MKLEANGLTVRATLLRQSLSIFDVLDKLGRPAPVHGTQQVLCPNPDHPERRPSARVYEDSNHVHCFRCGKSWDPVGLVMVMQGLDLGGAVDWLSLQFGIPDIGTMAPTVVSALARPGSRPDFTALVETVERTIVQARSTMGAAQYHRCWLALDVAADAYHRGAMDPETYEDSLGQIMEAAS